jgi:BlaI family transcriptional regulator, penicillinase repressor
MSSMSRNRLQTGTRPAGELGQLEQAVMDFVWRSGSVSAEQCREAVGRGLKDSTVRTVLRRLEEKGYVSHRVVGRTYLYQASQPKQHVAARAVRKILDRLCDGSVEQLLVGLVDNDVVTEEELQRLAKRIVKARGNRR